MIELRHLNAFVIACRHAGLASAASELGIAISTLSTNLKALELELGFALFRRSSSGLSPLPSARWLYTAASAVLLTEAFGRRWMRSSQRSAASLLTVEINLGFAFGRINNALSRAVEAMAAANPPILVTVRRPGEPHVDCASGLAEVLGLPSRGRITIDVGSDTTCSRRSETILLTDRWVLGCRLPMQAVEPPPAAQLFSGPVVIPALRPQLITQANAYLRQSGIAGASLSEDHPGALASLFNEQRDVAVFAPESLFSPQLGLPQIGIVAPEPPLLATIVARIEQPDPVADAFVGRLRDALQSSHKPVRIPAVLSSRKIRSFNVLNRVRRVSAAAQAANIAQPALSDQLRQLETTLRVRLFDRRADGLVPTADGERFAPVAEAVERGLQGIVLGGLSAQMLTGGRLSLGILPSVSQHGLLVNKITEAVLAVQSRHPQTKLVVLEGPNETLQSWVIKGRVGLAIVETGLPNLPRLPLSAPEPLATIAHPDHAVLPLGPVTLATLADLPLALPGRLFGLRQLLDAAARERGLIIRPRIEIDALAMLIAVLNREPICTVLPRSAVQRELDRGELVAHLIVEPEIVRTLFVIHSGDRSLTEPERDLVGSLRERLATNQDIPARRGPMTREPRLKAP